MKHPRSPLKRGRVQVDRIFFAPSTPRFAQDLVHFRHCGTSFFDRRNVRGPLLISTRQGFASARSPPRVLPGPRCMTPWRLRRVLPVGVDQRCRRQVRGGPSTAGRLRGGGGIRTHETAEPPTGFQDQRLQPDSATPPGRPSVGAVRSPARAGAPAAGGCRRAATLGARQEASPSLVYGAGLLIPFGRQPIEGSNPSASASGAAREVPTSPARSAPAAPGRRRLDSSALQRATRRRTPHARSMRADVVAGSRDVGRASRRWWAGGRSRPGSGSWSRGRC
jgi:hypothetical protein